MKSRRRWLVVRSQSNRRGFTLIEVMIALTLTGIAAAIASTAVGAARRTEVAVQTHRAHAEAELRLRAMLRDMLRHAPPSSMVNEPLVQLNGAEGQQALTFLSRGVVAPFGTGPVWRVHVYQANDSLTVDAVIANGGGAQLTPLHMSVGDVSSLSVRALEGATALEGVRWRDDWPVARTRPLAISLEWHRGTGARAGDRVPLIATLDALQAGSP